LLPANPGSILDEASIKPPGANQARQWDSYPDCRAILKDSTLAAYAGKAERNLDALVAVGVAHPDGRKLQKQIKAWRTKFFVFLADREVPPTNNVSEREISRAVQFS
jgi:hypothetical protein